MRTSTQQLAAPTLAPSKLSRAALAHMQGGSGPVRYPAQPVQPVEHKGKGRRRVAPAALVPQPVHSTAAAHALRLGRHSGPVGAVTAHAADGVVLLRAV